MKKEGAPKKEEGLLPGIKSAGFSSRIFGITKFILGVLLLPFVYSATSAFLNEIRTLEQAAYRYFSGGIISFLIIYLFVYEPAIIYANGQKIVEAVFRFFAPLVKVAPYLLPIYTIILSLVWLVYFLITRSLDAAKFFVFIFGFSMALHLVFSAKTLRSRQGDFLKSNYIFGFSFVYIMNTAILSFILSAMFDKFSFVNFCNNSFQIGKGVFFAAFHQLFL